jgi:hypothetical protein
MVEDGLVRDEIQIGMTPGPLRRRWSPDGRTWSGTDHSGRIGTDGPARASEREAHPAAAPEPIGATVVHHACSPPPPDVHRPGPGADEDAGWVREERRRRGEEPDGTDDDRA